MGAGLAAVTIGAKKAVDAAKNLNESVNAVNVVFGKAAPRVLKFGETAAKTAGLSARAFNELVTPVGAALQNVGFSADQAATASINLGTRAADMASVFNVDVSEALTAIQAGLRGEADPLERFGVGLSDAAVKSKAMAMGLAESEKAIDANDKAQARLALIMQQTNKLQGDFANTADQAANKERVLAAQRENDAAKIGSALIPAYTALLHGVAAVTPVIADFAASLAQKVGPAIEKTVAAVRTHWPQIQATITAVMAVVKRVVIEAWDAAQEAAQRLIVWYRTNLAPAIENVVSAVKAIWAKFGADITRIAQGAFGLLKTIIGNALKIVQAVINGVLAAIRGDWGEVWNSLKTVVSAALDSVTAVLRGFLAVVRGLASAFLAAASSVGRAIVDGIIAGVRAAASALYEAAKGVVTGALSAMKRAAGIESPSRLFAAEVGVPIGEGVGEGIYGAFAQFTPKVIAAIKALTDRMRAEVEARTATLGTSFSTLTGQFERAFGAKTQQLLTALGGKFDEQIAKVRAWQTELTGAERALQGMTASEKELSQLDAAEGERGRTLAVRQAEEAVAKAKSIEDAQERATAVAAAEEQLRVAQLAITRQRLSEAAALERAALVATAAEERAARDAQAAERIVALEAQKTAELANLEEFRRIQGEQMGLRLTELQGYLAKHPKEWAKVNRQIQKLLEGYGVDYKASGKLLGNAFASGLTASEKAVENAAKNLAKIPQSYLELKSPADKGPLSEINSWLTPLGPMLASQITAGMRAVAAASAGLGGAAVPAGLMGGYRAAGGGGQVININLNGTTVGSFPREIAAQAYTALLEEDRLRGGRLFNNTAPALT